MNHARLYVPVFILTLFTSAYLLFLIQPLFSKMLLPLLGGASHVWITAMMFFQLMLLLGYAYAHLVSNYLSLRKQAILQIAILGLALSILPFSIPESWTPPEGEDPILWQLGVMLALIGLPFFCLAATTPLMQHWFAHTDSAYADDPYFLYAASNAGSLLGLLSYPSVIQPLSTLPQQAIGWSGLFAVLIGLVLTCFAFVRKKDAHAPQAMGHYEDGGLSLRIQLVWLLLGFAPSSLMLGVTSFITSELGAVPMFWVMPLALYVGSYIIAFAPRPFISRYFAHFLQACALVLVGIQTLVGESFNSGAVMVLHLILFFFTALACHHEMHALRPKAGHLTRFYMIMATGGALGGIFNAVIAPQIFVVPLEYALVLIVAMFARYISEQSYHRSLERLRGHINTYGYMLANSIIAFLVVCGFAILSGFIDYTRFGWVAAFVISAGLIFLYDRRWLFATAASLVISLNPMVYWDPELDYIHFERNYYGVLRVAQNENYRYFFNGTILHGVQPRNTSFRHIPVSYFHPDTGTGDAFAWLNQQDFPQKVGVLGLGIGSLACYEHPRRDFTFYEIDPDVVEIAKNPDLFTYLEKCAPDVNVEIGDGRLQIRDANNDKYNLIFLDAFTSDNIPVHLMTLEAFKTYSEKLAEPGIIIANISNKYYDLRYELAAIADDLNMIALHKYTPPGRDQKRDNLVYNGAHYAVLVQNQQQRKFFLKRNWRQLKTGTGMPPWRDDYANLLRAIRWDSFIDF